jgi:hypothetical protein
MEKKDLRNGMVVEYRLGDLRMILSNSLLGVEGFERNKLCFYNDDLKDKDNETLLDIVKVYDLTSDVLSFSDAFDRENLKIIWERKETKKVFRAWKFLEHELKGVSNETIVSSVKSWVKKCEGLTENEMKKLHYICDENWMVEEALV